MLHLEEVMLHLGRQRTIDSIGLLQRCTWKAVFGGGREEGSTSLKVSIPTINKLRIEIR
jgi:hypothetical protein